MAITGTQLNLSVILVLTDALNAQMNKTVSNAMTSLSLLTESAKRTMELIFVSMQILRTSRFVYSAIMDTL